MAVRFGMVVSGCALLLLAWSWPATSSRLIHGFSEVVQKEHSRGLRIAHPSEAQVTSVHDGTLLLRVDSTPSPLTPPHVLGNFVVVSHSNSMYSLYAHLDTLFQVDPVINQGAPLGRGQVSSNNNQTNEREFEFRILDVHESGYINPLIVLPRQSDLLSPTLQDVVIYHEDSVITGQYLVLDIHSHDRLQSNTSLLNMPYFWGVQYGDSRYQMVLNGFREQNGSLTLVSNGRALSDAIPQLWHGRIGIIPYLETQKQLSIIVGDYFGRYIIRNVQYTQEDDSQE